MEKLLLAILGPTASGKSALALELAKRLNGEIISADSRQVYVGMDIGTDKPGHRGWGRGQRTRTRTPKAQAPTPNTLARDQPRLVEEIPHFLIDILTPDQHYSAAEFRTDALRIILTIHARGHLPMVVGGTAFYVRALTEALPLQNVPPDPAFRAWAEVQPLDALVQDLQRRAPETAQRLDRKNRRRVVRALEIVLGKPETRDQRPDSDRHDACDVLKLALAVPADELRKRITERVDRQLRDGLVEEVRRLVARYGEAAPGLQAIAYREVFPHLRGETSFAEAREAIIRANYRYARRQRTWLRKEPNLTWVQSPADALDTVEAWMKRARTHNGIRATRYEAL